MIKLIYRASFTYAHAVRTARTQRRFLPSQRTRLGYALFALAVLRCRRGWRSSIQNLSSVCCRRYSKKVYPSHFVLFLDGTINNSSWKFNVSIFGLHYWQNAKVREFCGTEPLISLKALHQTIFKLVELVELAIRNEMKNTRGAVMSNAWTKIGSYLLGISALFMRKVTRSVDGEQVHDEELSTPLLSLSPIAHRSVDDEVESAHAITFDSTTHIRELEHILNFSMLMCISGRCAKLAIVAHSTNL